MACQECFDIRRYSGVLLFGEDTCKQVSYTDKSPKALSTSMDPVVSYTRGMSGYNYINYYVLYTEHMII